MSTDPGHPNGTGNAIPEPALIAKGGALGARFEQMAVGPDAVETVIVLRAQVGVFVGVDCPLTAENVDALIKALRTMRGQLGGGLVTAGADDLAQLVRKNGARP